ncbi:hypothetical protein CHELA1G11_10902 [Hyphomicrobiales bacterium]|nr:hypothetical protein CHELA1G11_10902 [Hyphomicrobiales bacterium]CAH1671519.1 MarR family transcriptional regulator [Hyphomicrobiales bacterium]
MSVRSKRQDGWPSPGRTKKLTVSRPELLLDGSDTAFRELLHDTLAFSARIQDIRNRFGQIIGVSGAAYTILISVVYLGDEEGVGINQIAEHLHLSGAFVTIEVNKLVASGLVRKKINPADRRRVQLTVTRKARKLLEDLTAVQQPTNDMLFSDLSAQDFHFMRQLVARLVNSGDRALSLLNYLASQRASQEAAS